MHLIDVETDCTEHRHVAFRPVYLVEIDIVSLQARKAGLDGGENLLAIDARAVAYPGKSARGAGNLGGDDEAVARLMFEPGADVAFSQVLCCGARATGYISAVSIRFTPCATAISSC